MGSSKAWMQLPCSLLVPSPTPHCGLPPGGTMSFLTTVSLHEMVHWFQVPSPPSVGKSSQPLGLTVLTLLTRQNEVPAPLGAHNTFSEKKGLLMTPQRSFLILVSSPQINFTNEWRELRTDPTPQGLCFLHKTILPLE